MKNKEMSTLIVEPLNSLSIKSNLSEVKSEMIECLKDYQVLDFNDAQITEAKKTRANLNKLKKAVNDKKIAVKKEVLKDYNTWEAEVKEVMGLIEEPIVYIDNQIKESQEKAKELKKSQIMGYFSANVGDTPLTLEKIFGDIWLNQDPKMPKIEKDIDGWIEKVNNDYLVLNQLDSEFLVQIKDKYSRNLNLSEALQEKTRLEELKKQEVFRKLKSEQERKELEKELELKENETVNIYTGEIIEKEQEFRTSFRIITTLAKKDKLKKFMDDNFIKYESIN